MRGTRAILALLTIFAPGLPAISNEVGTKAVENTAQMVKVVGIGAFFFRAKDPERLAQWYEETFGISTVPRGYDSPPWRSCALTGYLKLSLGWKLAVT